MLDRLLHGDIPLVGQIRLDWYMAAITVPNFVYIFPNILQQLLLTEPFDNSFARLKTIHTEQRLRFRFIGVFPSILVTDRTVRRHHVDYVQPVPLADRPVIRVVGRRDFQKTGREFCLLVLTIGIGQNDMLISYDGNLATDNR